MTDHRRDTYGRSELRAALALGTLVALAGTLLATINGSPVDLLAGLPILALVGFLFNLRAPGASAIARVVAARRRWGRPAALGSRRREAPGRPLIGRLVSVRSLRGPPLPA